MARFTVSVDVSAAPERVWERLTDWPVHGRWIPATTVRVTSSRPDGIGATFVGHSAIGPIGFDDPMEITEWTPPVAGLPGEPVLPGHCRVKKKGRVLLGWAEFDVLARSGGSTVHWVEDVQLAPVWLTKAVDPVVAAIGRAGFTRALHTMASELEREVPSGG